MTKVIMEVGWLEKSAWESIRGGCKTLWLSRPTAENEPHNLLLHSEKQRFRDVHSSK